MIFRNQSNLIVLGIVGGSGYKSELGYSFYMACASLLGAIIDIVVGALTAALAQKDL